MNDDIKRWKKAIVDANRVRMHLQSAIAHLDFTTTSYMIPEQKKQIIMDAVLDCEIIVKLLDIKIKVLERQNNV